jgi:predicted nucleic acid-binding protein
MAAFVLDASVAISWCFPGDPTEDTPYSRRVLRELVANDAIVPEIWAYEIANNIFVSHSKRKGISEQQITEYLSILKALPIRVEPQSLWAKLDLALRTGLALATSDEPLRQAAIAQCITVLS